MVSTYKDKNGYHRIRKRNLGHSTLVHRQVAYNEIYKPNRERYPKPFSEYVVHHKDGNKENPDVSNLEILTPEEHNNVHNHISYRGGYSSDSGYDYSGYSEGESIWKKWWFIGLMIILVLVVIFIVIPFFISDILPILRFIIHSPQLIFLIGFTLFCIFALSSS